MQRNGLHIAFRCMLNILVLQIAITATISHADENDRESVLKVAFLYNFIKVTEWPTTATNQPSWNLCIMHDEKLTATITSIEGKVAQGKPVHIQHIANAAALKTCHAFYTSETEASKLKTMFSELNGAPVLTIGESSSFVSHGGMIGLVSENGKLGFDVNLNASQNAGIRFGSQLLRVARNVTGAQR